MPAAAAFALNVDVDLLGAIPLDVGPVARLRLSGDAGRRFENALKVQVPPLLEALVLATGGETKLGADPSAKASARVATVKLHLLGDLLIKVLKSECHVTADTVDVASDVVFADGSVLGIGIDMLGLQPGHQVGNLLRRLGPADDHRLSAATEDGGQALGEEHRPVPEHASDLAHPVTPPIPLSVAPEVGRPSPLRTLGEANVSPEPAFGRPERLAHGAPKRVSDSLRQIAHMCHLSIHKKRNRTVVPVRVPVHRPY